MSKRTQELNEQGFYKVGMKSHYSFTQAIYFNPKTNEVKNITCSDTDDDRRDDWDMFYEKTSEEVMPVYLIYLAKERLAKSQHDKTAIYAKVGDKIQTIKGRKVKAGLVGIVKAVREYCDKYNRYCCTYLTLEDDTRVIAENSIIIEAKELM